MFPPCLRHRRSACATSRAVRLPAHRVSRSASCRAACCPLAMYWRCTVRLLQRPREQGQRAPCLRRTCCLAWGLSSLSFVGVRIKRPTARGGIAVRDCHDFESMSTGTMASAGRSDRRRSKGPCYKFGVTGGWRVKGARKVGRHGGCGRSWSFKTWVRSNHGCMEWRVPRCPRAGCAVGSVPSSVTKTARGGDADVWSRR